MFLEISYNSQGNTCEYDQDLHHERVSFLIKLEAPGLQLYLKKSLKQVLSCEFC